MTTNDVNQTNPAIPFKVPWETQSLINLKNTVDQDMNEVIGDSANNPADLANANQKMDTDMGTMENAASLLQQLYADFNPSSSSSGGGGIQPLGNLPSSLTSNFASILGGGNESTPGFGLSGTNDLAKLESGLNLNGTPTDFGSLLAHLAPPPDFGSLLAHLGTPADFGSLLAHLNNSPTAGLTSPTGTSGSNSIFGFPVAGSPGSGTPTSSPTPDPGTPDPGAPSTNPGREYPYTNAPPAVKILSAPSANPGERQNPMTAFGSVTLEYGSKVGQPETILMSEFFKRSPDPNSAIPYILTFNLQSPLPDGTRKIPADAVDWSQSSFKENGGLAVYLPNPDGINRSVYPAA